MMRVRGNRSASNKTLHFSDSNIYREPSDVGEFAKYLNQHKVLAPSLQKIAKNIQNEIFGSCFRPFKSADPLKVCEFLGDLCAALEGK